MTRFKIPLQQLIYDNNGIHTDPNILFVYTGISRKAGLDNPTYFPLYIYICETYFSVELVHFRRSPKKCVAYL